MDFATARSNMVESQLRTNKVTDDRLADAMRTIPRELFVPEDRRGIAYVDEELALPRGRFLVEPMVFARMVQFLDLTGAEKVLDVGAATGYSTAVLARLAAHVIGVEPDEGHVAAANATLVKLGITNFRLRVRKLPEGVPEEGPYQAILVNGAVAEIPGALKDQLAENGRLVAIVRGERGIGRVTLVQRTSPDAFSTRIVFDAATPILPGFESRPGFVF